MGHRDGLLVTQTYLSRQATTAPYLTRSVRRTAGFVLTRIPDMSDHFQPKVEVRFTSTHVGSRLERTSTRGPTGASSRRPLRKSLIAQGKPHSARESDEEHTVQGVLAVATLTAGLLARSRYKSYRPARRPKPLLVPCLYMP